MKRRSIAIILAFFGGGFGLHKFYLGEKIAGLFYLFFSWTLIPSILAIFDFVNLVLISSKDFDRQYNLPEISHRPYLNPAQNNIDNLKQLKELYDSGIITAEEYEQKRRKFVDLL